MHKYNNNTNNNTNNNNGNIYQPSEMHNLVHRYPWRRSFYKNINKQNMYNKNVQSKNI